MAYKHDYDKTLTRLRIILQRLNDGELLSVKELAEELGVNVRTIQRDFNERLVGNYPIEKKGRKWKMQDGFKIEKIRDIDEKIVLDILEQITSGIGGGFATKSSMLLEKLKNKDFNPIYAKLNIEDISASLKDVALLEEAINKKLEIKCQYTRNNSSYKTTIQPLKIVNYEGFWYVIALNKEKVKKYYLRSLSNLKLTSKIFSVDTKIDQLLENSLSIWFNQEKEPYEVILYANSLAAKYFQRRPLPTQSILSTNSDGSIEFSVKITDDMELLPLIKYWIPHLFVLKPQHLQEKLLKDVEKFKELQTQFQ